MTSNIFKRLVLIIAITLSAQSWALFENSLLGCGYVTANKIKQSVTSHMYPQDKYKHCAISCMVSNECGVISSATLGIGKEIFDLIGPGESDLSDMIANIFGIKFNIFGIAKDEKECKDSCFGIFPSLTPKSIL